MAITNRGWGWGDWWGALCLLVAIVAGATGGLSAGGWIALLLAGVLGYGLLNVLQTRIDRAEEWRQEIAERECDRDRRDRR